MGGCLGVQSGGARYGNYGGYSQPYNNQGMMGNAGGIIRNAAVYGTGAATGYIGYNVGAQAARACFHWTTLLNWSYLLFNYQYSFTFHSWNTKQFLLVLSLELIFLSCSLLNQSKNNNSLIDIIVPLII